MRVALWPINIGFVGYGWRKDSVSWFKMEGFCDCLITYRGWIHNNMGGLTVEQNVTIDIQ